MEHLSSENPEELFLMLIVLLTGAVGRTLHDMKMFIQVHSFAFHLLMSAAQWGCYMVSFMVGAITVYKFFRRNGYK